MCLAIPGKLIWAEERDGNRIGKVQFGGITREVFLNFVPEAVPGDYVIVHVGYALAKLDPLEAARTLATFAEAGLLPAPEAAR